MDATTAVAGSTPAMFSVIVDAMIDAAVAGTSPEGCTIGGLMVTEEAGLRGYVGKALREAVTIARLMDGTRPVNDTRE
ncbi:hypothetical protein EYZ11_007787 [Aspergillus tanneri]|uniref:Pyrroline-5-carboxylate reductase dimerisation domain-containing protein n=1 Tax=Aspergillus tanneri TaxID=1220188 RepID=A0A4S3JC47_9EURO|nr:hypothetical protein EYZ11_007787 [Aspergillus tanneri]